MEVIRPRPTFGRCPGAYLENRWRSVLLVSSSLTASAWQEQQRASGVTVALLVPTQPIRVQILGDVLRNSPVVQRQRCLVHIQETMVRFHPGLLNPSR